MTARPEIRHIGVWPFLCGVDPDKLKTKANYGTDRTDLSYGEYKDWERHPLKPDVPWRYCKRCLSVIRAREGGL